MHSKSQTIRTAVVLLFVGVCASISSAQSLANTPGGLRPITIGQQSIVAAPCNVTKCAASAMSSQIPAHQAETASSAGHLPVAPLEEQDLLSGEVLYESQPADLAAISEADSQYLVANMLQIVSNSTILDLVQKAAASMDHLDSASQPIAAIPPSLGESNKGPTAAPSSQEEVIAVEVEDQLPALAILQPLHMARGTYSGVNDVLATDISRTSNVHKGKSTIISVSIGSPVSPGASTGSAGAAEGTIGLSQPTVTGPVMTAATAAAPGMNTIVGGYEQAVVASLKMNPIRVEQLSILAGSGDAAVAWQHNLESSLQNATASTTGMSRAQIQTKITSVINLGLEVAEPPAEYAAEAAASIANVIKAMTDDDSLLVGVSLVRLGSSSALAASSGPTSVGISRSSDSTAIRVASTAGAAPIQNMSFPSSILPASTMLPAQPAGNASISSTTGFAQPAVQNSFAITAAPVGPNDHAATADSPASEAMTDWLVDTVSSSLDEGNSSSFNGFVGAGSSSTNNNVRRLTELASSWLEAAAGGTGRLLFGTKAVKTVASNNNASLATKLNVSGPSSGRSGRPMASTMLALLSLHGGSTPAQALSMAATLKRNCPELFVYGPAIVNSTCGKLLLTSYNAAVNEAIFASIISNSTNTEGSLNSTISLPGSRTTVADSSTSGPADITLGNPAMTITGFTATTARVRQLPEINIIISQAVGTTVALAPDVLQQLSTMQTTTLPGILKPSGLSISQTATPQIVDLLTRSPGDSSTPVVTPPQSTEVGKLGLVQGVVVAASNEGQSSGADDHNGMIIGVAIAAALAVVSISAAVAVVVVVKQRAKATAAVRADDDNLPKKRRKTGSKAKGKGFTSKYLPTSMLNTDKGSSPLTGSDGTNRPVGLVTLQLPIALSSNLAVLSPPLSVSPHVAGVPGTLLLHHSPVSGGNGGTAGVGLVPPGLSMTLLSPGGGASHVLSPTHSNTSHTSSTPPLLPAAVAMAAHAAAGQPITRGDSVSSAVRFDLEADATGTSSNSSDDDDDDDEAASGDSGNSPDHYISRNGSSGERNHNRNILELSRVPRTMGMSSSRNRPGSARLASGSSRCNSFTSSRPGSAVELRTSASNLDPLGEALANSAAAAIRPCSGHNSSSLHVQQRLPIPAEQPQTWQQQRTLPSHPFLRHRSPSPAESMLQTMVRAAGMYTRSSGGGNNFRGGTSRCSFSMQDSSSSAVCTPRWPVEQADAPAASVTAAAPASSLLLMSAVLGDTGYYTATQQTITAVTGSSHSSLGYVPPKLQSSSKADIDSAETGFQSSYAAGAVAIVSASLPALQSQIQESTATADATAPDVVRAVCAEKAAFVSPISVACLRVFSRILSASTLQDIEAAVAEAETAMQADVGSSSSNGDSLCTADSAMSPNTPSIHAMHLLQGGGSSCSSQHTGLPAGPDITRCTHMVTSNTDTVSQPQDKLFRWGSFAESNIISNCGAAQTAVNCATTMSGKAASAEAGAVQHHQEEQSSPSKPQSRQRLSPFQVAANWDPSLF